MIEIKNPSVRLLSTYIGKIYRRTKTEKLVADNFPEKDDRPDESFSEGDQDGENLDGGSCR